MKDRIEKYIRDWERKCYSNGLPDAAPPEIKDLVPSYKLIALSILRNDYALKALGFQQPKSKVYSALERIEIDKRPSKYGKQLKLF